MEDMQPPSTFKRRIPVALVPFMVFVGVILGPSVSNSVPTFDAVSTFAAGHPYWYASIVASFAIVGAVWAILLNDRTWAKKHKEIAAIQVTDYKAYAKKLVLERTIPISEPGLIGVEMEFINQTGHQLSLHLQRDRVLYGGCLVPVRVETPPSLANNGRGSIRVALRIDPTATPGTVLNRVAQDHALGQVKEIDVEDLDIMARLSEKSKIIVDVTVPMPERQAYNLTLKSGVWTLGRTQYMSAIGV